VQRRLILMRHAKAAAHSPNGRDHGRPLAERGLRDAGFMAEVLEKLGWSPAKVVSSDAARTRQTWASMNHTSALSIPVDLHPELYLAGLPAIRSVARGWTSEHSGPVLLLGHNPGWEMAASTLSGRILGMTTANAVLLEGDGETWSAALNQPWRLVRHLVPKQIRRNGL